MFYLAVYTCQAFPGGSMVRKNPPANTRDLGLIPGSGRSSEGGNGSPLQYSCLGNFMKREAWCTEVHRVAKSRTGLSSHANTHTHTHTHTRQVRMTLQNWTAVCIKVTLISTPLPIRCRWSELRFTFLCSFGIILYIQPHESFYLERKFIL